MTLQKKKRRNLLHIDDPKLNKLFWSTCAIAAALILVSLGIVIFVLISSKIDEPGTDLASNDSVISFILKMFAYGIIAFTAFLAVNIYVLITNLEKAEAEKKVAELESPLLGAAKEHQDQIIDLLKTVAHPLPDKTKLNRAHTAQFLTALKELEWIDPNFVGKHLMVWVQDTTGYIDGSPSAFTQALNAVKTNDPEVARLKDQISKIVKA